MIKTILLLSGFLWFKVVLALSGQAYLDRFNLYRTWKERLPISPTKEFIDFIKEDAPLSQKLRQQWLYELAKNKAWESYLTYYQPSQDLNLQCYKQIALYHTGQQEEALHSSTGLWLSANSQPPACSQLFSLLLKMKNFNQNLITQRLILALSKGNISLAMYLLKQYKGAHGRDIQNLTMAYKNPLNINKLSKNDLTDDFYLYGLMRLVSINMDKAITFWKQATKLLNESQEQAFLAHLALYKAMRNHTDTFFWFNQVKTQYYNEVLIDWAIRFALKQEDWPQVIKLINLSENKNCPCWQYWLARSLEAQAKNASAQILYESLAKHRNYYGFLASLRINKLPSFENESTITKLMTLQPYQPVLDEIQLLYKTNKKFEASRLLTDFISELPKEEARALLYWVNAKLQWYARTVYLSSNEKLNNQLDLRFPLAYNDTIRLYSSLYGILPEFAYAIIRQESAFRDDVISSAGARGLMQIMPKTALLISRLKKIPYKDQSQLFLSQKNINIGIAYLQQLARRFNNHPVLIAAAYNAGPSQVVHWLKSSPSKEVDIWIETLPWQETRNYLKNVIAFYIVYQYRLQLKPNVKPLMRSLAPIH